MGIWGLASGIRRYGAATPMAGDTVVIDGPALVHRIFYARQTIPPEAFMSCPSYAAFGEAVIKWLDDLHSKNVNIRKIYFDGYLPPSKWDVRRKRYNLQYLSMKDMARDQPNGSRRIPQAYLHPSLTGLALTSLPERRSQRKLPQLPFLVPAVLDILKKSTTWWPLCHIVPGEADAYCAEDVKLNGGTVLTTDSDLAISDLGPDGSMSFIDDVRTDDSDNSNLITNKFTPKSISDRFGLADLGGVARVAFEMQREKTGFDKAVGIVRDTQGFDFAGDAVLFTEFLQEHSTKHYLLKGHPVESVLGEIDPRVSEMVVQSLVVDEKGGISEESLTMENRGSELLSMFLPVMVENRYRKSAWTMSMEVRRIAYGISQTFARHVSPSIIEYRMIDDIRTKAGRQIDIPSLRETLGQCELLVKTVNQLAQALPDKSLQWLAFAIYQDIVFAVSEDKPSLCASLCAVVGTGQSDECSWDLIHFTAQVQASLYSLRMIKQTIDVAAHLTQDLRQPVRDLRDLLSTLPDITEWPTVNNMSETLAEAQRSGILDVVTELLDVTPIVEPKYLGTRKMKPAGRRKSGSHRVMKSARSPPRSASLNPYAVLSQASTKRGETDFSNFI
ncbi:hypothetical protein F5Y18DRAFT_381314 [Xylariaceae sp. FL1019]|nr:hypothetical protein F5Y18DRAFT_381314 [Xylariaceae sp. FL1019]